MVGGVDPSSPPFADEAALLARARGLAGRTLSELNAQEPLPDLSRHKGFVGELLERALGLPRNVRPEPDVVHLGVEVKTLPVGSDGRPKESTYVCRVDLTTIHEATWPDSRAHAKLKRVLFIPVLSDRQTPPEHRRVGTPILWSPSIEQEAVLRADWEDVADLCGRGLLEAVSARRGKALQVRPKAARAAVRGNARDADGEPLSTSPRGFYLRPTFTEAILTATFGAPGRRAAVVQEPPE